MTKKIESKTQGISWSRINYSKCCFFRDKGLFGEISLLVNVWMLVSAIPHLGIYHQEIIMKVENDFKAQAVDNGHTKYYALEYII